MRRWLIWLFPLALAIAILWLSHQPRLPMGVSLPPPLDKIAHASAFAALAFALDLALGNTVRGLPFYKRHLIVFAVVALYGAVDEWHQRHVPGRSCDVYDWVADVIGTILGLKASALPFLWTRKALRFSWWRGNPSRPDPARPLILVADPHWSEELLGLREASHEYPEADWLFLGDVFDVWVGLPGMETDAQRSFLWWVAERRNAGRWVGLWMGNREYFLDGRAKCFDYMGEGTGGALPGEKLAFEHGDLVNSRDRKYRAWNLISRSGFLWVLLQLLPKAWACRLAQKLEQMLRTTNRDYKLAFPREAFRKAAGEMPLEWVFITGHFHTAEEEGNGYALPWAREAGFQVWNGVRVEPLKGGGPRTE